MKLFHLILILIATFMVSFAQKPSTRPDNGCLIGDQIISSTPVSFLGLKDAPAKITATIGGYLGKDKTREGVRLKNLSGKTIKMIKVKWFLFRVDVINGIVTPRETPKFIMQSESQNIETNEFKPNEEKKFDYLINSCREIYDALVKDGETEGELWFEPTVSEITYADGSKWIRQ